MEGREGALQLHLRMGKDPQPSTAASRSQKGQGNRVCPAAFSRNRPCEHSDFSPLYSFQISVLWNCKITNLCSFQPQSLG